MTRTMTRSRMQVMRSLLPGQILQHENDTVVRVIAVETERPSADPDILFATLTAELDRWRNYRDAAGNLHNRATGFPDPAQFRDGYVLLTPTDDVIYRPWPLTLRCTNPVCEKAIRFADDEAWATANDPALCDLCGSAREQFPYLMVHTCGDVRDIWMPECAKHGRQHIYLKDRRSFETSSWHCRAPGCNGRRLEGMRTPGCSCGEGGLFVGRTIRQENRFLTHGFPFVNFERSSRLRLEQTPGSHTVVIGYYLGLIDNYEQALHDAGNEVDPVLVAKAEELLEAMRASGSATEEQLAQLRDRMLPKTSQALATTQRIVPADIRNHVGSDQRARERTLIFAGAGGLRTWTLDSFEAAAVGSGRESAGEVLHDARVRLREMGFSDLLVVENFPVALVSYGFTRLSRSPADVLLRPFPSRTSGKAKDNVPIYVAESTTEAAFFELDAARVLGWLDANGIYPAPLLPSDDGAPTAAKAAVLVACEQEPAVAHHVYLLQHTIAHALVRNLGERSGFAENTMAEYLMPVGMLTFGLFADTHQDFTLGALVSLVEHRLVEWLDATWDGVRSCDWDPHCARAEGACMACLHLAFGCNQFNADLDRAVLIGSPADHTPVIATGYWSEPYPSTVVTHPKTSRSPIKRGSDSARR